VNHLPDLALLAADLVKPLGGRGLHRAIAEAISAWVSAELPASGT
jgi:hypothetical protein